MYTRVEVRTPSDVTEVFIVRNLYPVLGDPARLSVMLIAKMCEVSKDEIITEISVFDDDGNTIQEYDRDALERLKPSINDILNAATSDDIGDMSIIPKVNIKSTM